jgi:hypothetical protein
MTKARIVLEARAQYLTARGWVDICHGAALHFFPDWAEEIEDYTEQLRASVCARFHDRRAFPCECDTEAPQATAAN